MHLSKIAKTLGTVELFLHVEGLDKRLESELIVFLASTSSLVLMTAANKSSDFAWDCRTF